MDTNDLTVKPARDTEYRFGIVVTEWGVHMGVQTGDISGKIGTAVIELGGNARERDAVSQVANLDVSVDIGMCPARFPGRTREHRREHHLVASFDERSIKDELPRVVREILENDGLANFDQMRGVRLFFEIIIPDDMREGRHVT